MWICNYALQHRPLHYSNMLTAFKLWGLVRSSSRESIWTWSTSPLFQTNVTMMTGRFGSACCSKAYVYSFVAMNKDPDSHSVVPYVESPYPTAGTGWQASGLILLVILVTMTNMHTHTLKLWHHGEVNHNSLEQVIIMSLKQILDTCLRLRRTSRKCNRHRYWAVCARRVHLNNDY